MRKRRCRRESHIKSGSNAKHDADEKYGSKLVEILNIKKEIEKLQRDHKLWYFASIADIPDDSDPKLAIAAIVEEYQNLLTITGYVEGRVSNQRTNYDLYYDRLVLYISKEIEKIIVERSVKAVKQSACIALESILPIWVMMRDLIVKL